MTLNDIVSAFKNHQLQYGLNGDSMQQELYKWTEWRFHATGIVQMAIDNQTAWSSKY